MQAKLLTKNLKEPALLKICLKRPCMAKHGGSRTCMANPWRRRHGMLAPPGVGRAISFFSPCTIAVNRSYQYTDGSCTINTNPINPPTHQRPLLHPRRPFLPAAAAKWLITTVLPPFHHHLMWRRRRNTSALPKAVLLVNCASMPSPKPAASALLRPAMPVSTARARFTKSILVLRPFIM